MRQVSVLLPLLLASIAATARSAEPTIAELRATQRVLRQVAQSVRPSLVRIETVGGAQIRGEIANLEEFDPDYDPEQGPRPRSPFRDPAGSSFQLADGPTTGLVYSADGYIITSSFNFVRDPVLISVTLADGRQLAADLVARDQVRKIALLKVDAKDLPVPRWLPREKVRVGQWSVALGLGFGGSEPSISVGIISALHRMMDNAVQTDAKLSPVNYGGPLCDIEGRVLGISVPMAQRPGELAGVEMYDSGVGFALPKSRVDEIVGRLKKGESVYRGWLGISLDRHRPDAVVVGNVADPSPMKVAGVEPGDVIHEVNGAEMRHFGSLMQALYMVPAGEQVELAMGRGDEVYRITVSLARGEELGELPEEEEPFDPSNPLPENHPPLPEP